METLYLQNGLKVLFESMPNTHSITLGLYIKIGARNEDGNNIGITHLLEHLHFRELCDLSQDDLYYNMEKIGSTLKASTYYDFLKFTMKIRPKYFQNCIVIFKKILSAYSWSQESFDREKDIVLKQISEQNAIFSSEPFVRKCLFGDNSLSNRIMGDEDSVNRISLNEVINYKKKSFTKENMILCLTGNVCETEIKQLLSEFEEIEVFPYSEAKCYQTPKTLYCRKPNISFCKDNWNYFDVDIAFDIDYSVISIEELKILNCILGEGVGSRLQKTIRERHGYSTNIYSEPEIYSDFAVLHIKFSVEKTELIECLLSIFDIIADLKTNIGPEDLDVSLPFYSENKAFLLDDTESMNFELAYNYFIIENNAIGFSAKNNTEYRQHLMDISKKAFVPHNTSVILFGNCNRITKSSIRDIILKSLIGQGDGAVS